MAGCGARHCSSGYAMTSLDLRGAHHLYIRYAVFVHTCTSGPVQVGGPNSLSTARGRCSCITTLDSTFKPSSSRAATPNALYSLRACTRARAQASRLGHAYMRWSGAELYNSTKDALLR